MVKKVKDKKHQKQAVVSSVPDATPPASTKQTKQAKLVQKKKDFLQKVTVSAHSAKVVIAKRKKTQLKKGATLQALGALFDALPGQAAKPGAMPSFLTSSAGKTVRAKARTKVCQTEAARMSAVLSDARFQSDPLSAVTNHLLALAPPAPDVAMGRSRPAGKKVKLIKKDGSKAAAQGQKHSHGHGQGPGQQRAGRGGGGGGGAHGKSRRR